MASDYSEVKGGRCLDAQESVSANIRISQREPQISADGCQ